jgi:hypothetical protein
MEQMMDNKEIVKRFVWTDTLNLAMVILALAGLSLWNRTETMEEFRAIRMARDEDNRRTQDLLKAINDEMKDFHGRLCAIEERKKEAK